MFVPHDTGRYCKYFVPMSQTPWEYGEGEGGDTSVLQLMKPHVVEAFPGSGMYNHDDGGDVSDHVFSSSGREDDDVRMLGTGRPFVFEIKEPHYAYDISEEKLRELESKISKNSMYLMPNSASPAISVQQMAKISRQHVTMMRIGESEKKKIYVRDDEYEYDIRERQC